MAENSNPLGTDLQSAQQAIRAMMAPLEDNATGEDAPLEEASEGEGYDAQAEYNESEADDGQDTEGYDDEEPQGAPDRYNVKVNGEEIEVTLDELLNGYSRQSDYTRKSQELAERRKSIEALEQEITAEREQYAELLPRMREQLQQQLQAEPDWDKLYEQNPVEAVKLERKWKEVKQQREQQIQAVQAEQQRLMTIRQRQMQEQVAKQLEAEQARLPDMIPEWKNSETAKKEAKEIRDFLLTKGFSEQDVDGITHAGVVALARNAMLFEKGRAKISEAKGQAKPGPKPMRAGSQGTQPRRRGDVEKAHQRLKQTGRVTDAAQVIKSLL
jgi:chromosome segregation ATPase